MYSSPIDREDTLLFERWKPLAWITIAIIVIAGLAIRLYDLKDAPLDFHPTRQLHSALIARGMYYENLPGVPDWQRSMAVRQWKAEGLIEPQIMERLAAFTYRLVGSDYLWIPRLYAIFFWMVGALFLFLLARDLFGLNGAVISLAYFLILPFGAIASRAFQPEPLLVASMIAAYWAMYRWFRCQTWAWALLAGALAGWSIYVKATAVFFMAGAWLGLILMGLGFLNAVKNKQVWSMAVLTIAPYLGYHVYSMYFLKLLESQFSLRFFPQMWIDPAVYVRWNHQLTATVGFEFLLVGLIGLFTIRDRVGRGMLIGTVIAYFIYGLVFSYYITTHSYYQEPLIPLVALGIGAGTTALMRAMRGPRWLVSAAVVGILLFAVATQAYDIRATLKRQNYASEIKFWEKLGQEIGPGAAVVGLLQDYGYRLAYWGWITPTNWMASGDFDLRALARQTYDMKKLFEETVAGKQYFVVTVSSELNQQPVLKKLLKENYAIYKQTSDYTIYDLHKKPE
jgi:hypothetical protein